jgi:hypothetical protein
MQAGPDTHVKLKQKKRYYLIKTLFQLQDQIEKLHCVDY